MQVEIVKNKDADSILILSLFISSSRLMKLLINFNSIISVIFFFRTKMLFTFILIKSIN